MSRILSLRDVHRTYGEPPVAACAGISLDIDRGEFVAVVGPSGSGKSTLLNLIGTLDRPSSGRVEIDGLDVAGLTDPELSAVRARRIGFVFQQFHLSDGMTAIDNVADGLLYLGVPRAERRRRAEAALRRVGLERRLRHRPHQLSGGMRQRVVIAIALAARPRLIIADEPTTALDVTVQAQILRLMTDLIHAEGCSLMLITHDLAVVSEIADRINVMYCGRIVESGSARAVIDGSLHPYTLGLINSIPDLNREQGRFKTIPGIVPNMFDLPQGCRFSPRCERAQDLCRTSVPDLRELEPGHCVACHFPIHREVRS